MEEKEAENITRRRRMIGVAIVVLVLPIFFWAVSVVESRGFYPDHPHAEGEDPNPLFQGGEGEDEESPGRSREVDVAPDGRWWHLDSMYWFLTTLLLAALAFVMHVKSRRRTARRALGAAGDGRRRRRSSEKSGAREPPVNG
jgi:hypothetical protein